MKAFPTLGLLAVASLGATSCVITHETRRPHRHAVEASAPAAGAGAVTSAMAYPTGSRATSALLVEKTTPGEIRLNRPFDYVVRVTNLTEETLNRVVLLDALPPSFEVKGGGDEVKVGEDKVAEWNVGVLDPWESRELKLEAVATEAGSFETCSTVTYDLALCVDTRVIDPKLTLTGAGPAEVIRNDRVLLTYTVENAGTGTARDVVLRGNFPDGLKGEDGGSTFELHVGDLAEGAARDFTVAARAAERGEHKAAATAYGADELASEATELTVAVREPELKIERTGTSETFLGRRIEYELVVTNVGDGVARDAFVEDRVPPRTRFHSATEGGVFVDGRVRWRIGELEPGGKRTLGVVLEATEVGGFDATARATARSANPVEAGFHTKVMGRPAVTVEVVDLNDPVEVGAEAVYVVSVINQGTAAATSVEVTCTLPDNVTFVASSGPSESSLVGKTLSFEGIASIAAGDEATWRVTVRGESPADARFKVSLTTGQLSSPLEETEATNFYE